MSMMSALSKPTVRATTAEPLVEISGLTKLYPIDTGWLSKRRSWLSALEDVDLTVNRGEILAVVGESGSGKSTLARLLIKLIEPTRGEVRYEGENIFGLSPGRVRRFRRKVQIVFQDPYSSLNPRHNVAQIVGEGINGLAATARRARTRELLELVELAPKQMLFSNPRHPYTQALLSAVPVISSRREKKRRIVLSGEIPTAIDIPTRCRFATRCFRSIEMCWKEVPRLKEVERDHLVACFNHAPLAEALSS